MPNIKSAIKRVRTTETAEARNNADNKAELVNFAIKSVDKAAHSNLIHSNKADRIKSQLMSSSK